MTYTYDRRGRQATCVHSGTTTTRFYHDAGLLLGEAYSGGTLGGWRITNYFDASLRRTGVSTLSPSSQTLSAITYSYDPASRLSTVSDGVFSATYTYLANSPLVSQIDFKSNAVTRMTTTKQYDFLNRLQSISSAPSAQPLSPISYSYQYNDANQRLRTTLADGSYWLYEYDALGQVKSGKRYWSDHTPVAGQQNEYAFDDIGNRTTTKTGGDANGANLRTSTYTSNSRNQYTARTVPGAFDVLGIANSAATVTVNGSAADHRRGEYFQEEVSVSNGSAAVWQGVSVIAANGGGGTTNSGSVFVAKTPENPAYDTDGNLTQDGHWDYTWDAENRLTMMKTRSGIAGPVRRLEFEYDCQGRRIRKRVYDALTGGNLLLENRFLYDGWNLTAVLSSTFQLLSSYTWGLDLSGSLQGAGGVGGLVAVKTASNGTHFAAFDGNGNVAALVDGGNGTGSASYEYGPFGETIRATGPLALTNPFRFSTKY